jgi:hypothetical protein
MESALPLLVIDVDQLFGWLLRFALSLWCSGKFFAALAVCHSRPP